MEFRLLKEDEVPQLRQCLEELAEYHNRVADSFAGVYPVFSFDYQLESMAEDIGKGTARIEVLVDVGEIVGLCKVSRDRHLGEVDLLYLRPALRGRGLGRRLLDSGLAYLREQGATLVDIRVVAGNRARKFYEDNGFRLRNVILSMKV